MRRPPLIAVAAIVLLPAGRAAGQQFLTLRDVDGEVGFDFGGAWIDYAAAPSASSREFQEWLRVVVRGDVVHPQLLAFRVGLRPVFNQFDFTGTLADNGGRGRALGVDASLAFLPLRPVSLTLDGTRSTATRRASFGTETRGGTSHMRASLNWTNKYFPMSLHYDRRTLDQTWTQTGRQSIRRMETTNTTQLSARNRKTSMLLERLDFVERGIERRFTTYRSLLDHRLRWGKGSSLLSSFRYDRRTGNAPFTRLSWTEAARLQHTWTLRSEHNYGFSSLQLPSGSVRTLTGTIAVHYQVLRNLTVGLDLSAQSSKFTAGAQRGFRLGPRIAFVLYLPAGARLEGGGSVGYEWQRQEPGDDGFVPVVDERHVVDSSRRSVLNEVHVDASTIVVTSDDGSIVYVEDLDYQVVTVQPLTEIFVLPGSRIQIGDLVLVDYRYQVSPAGSGNMFSGSYRASLHKGGFTAYYRRAVREQPDGGRGVLLVREYDDIATGVRFRRGIGTAHLAVGAERRERTTDGLHVVGYNLHGSLSVRIRPNLGAAVDGSGGVRSSTTLDATYFSAGGSVNWAPIRSVRLTARLAHWQWQQDGLRDHFIGVGADAEWRFAAVAVQLSYDRNRRRDGFEYSEDRLTLRLVRRF